MGSPWTPERDAALTERDRHAEISGAQAGLAAAAVDEMVGLRARVATLEAVLAEPSEEERLTGVALRARWAAERRPDTEEDPEQYAVLAVLADLRKRAGVTDAG